VRATLGHGHLLHLRTVFQQVNEVITEISGAHYKVLSGRARPVYEDRGRREEVGRKVSQR